MNSNIIKTILTIGISLIFAVFFMWLALRGLDFESIKSSLQEANYFWVIISAFFAVLAYGFRAVRWNLLLEPMGYKILISNAFWTIAFGYMMNLTIPRSGEVARATALYGVEKVAVDKSIATIVVERIVDLMFMFGFLLLTFIFNREVLFAFYDKMTNYVGDGNTDMGSSSVIPFWAKLLAVLIIGGIILLIFYKFSDKIISFMKGILSGLKSILKLKSRFKFLLYSLGIWVCYFLSAYLICFALEGTSFFSIGDGFLIITAGTLGMLVPTSGGAGSFHIAVKLAIGGIYLSLGKNQEQGEEVGLTYALLSHTMQIVIMLVMGLIALPILLKRKRV